MNSPTASTEGKSHNWVQDFWGALAAMLVALPSSIAFGVLVYSGIGAEHAGQGAMAGILGASALGLVAAWAGRTGGLISAPCAPSAAVLSTLVVGLLSGKAGVTPSIETIPALLGLTALMAAIFQIIYGSIGAGRLIKFIPYPVVSGYLSGVGVLIALGQLPKLLGLPKGTAPLAGLTSPQLWQWPAIIVGFATMVVMIAAPRFTRKVPPTTLGLSAGILTYLALGCFMKELLRVDGNALVIGPITASGVSHDFMGAPLAALKAASGQTLSMLFLPALTLSVLLSIDTLKTCVVLDALTRSRHNSNRELIGQGIGNLASFAAGGMPGAGTMGPTLVNVTSGGRTPASGMMAGGFALIAFLLLGRFIAWVPIGALAGILLVVAWRMFDRGMFRLLQYRAGWQDFAVIAAVILVAVFVDLIAASGAGVALSIVLFIRDQIKGSVIRRKRTLDHVSSKTRRLPAEREVLNREGKQAVLCQLQGNLFFGTTDQLLSELAEDLKSSRFVVLDLRHVESMDYTAAHLFSQMEARLSERKGRLIFCGMPSALRAGRNFEQYLGEMGVTKKEGGVLISDTLDGALEWIEEEFLKEAGLSHKNGSEPPLEPGQFPLFKGLHDSCLAALQGCLSPRKVAKGERVFSHGGVGDELFLVRSGSVRVLLPLEGGKHHHLATIGRGDFFGELSFLDHGVRSADAEAKVDTELFVLSRARFEVQAKAHPDFGAPVFARLALVIGKRLRQADAELSIVEER